MPYPPKLISCRSNVIAYNSQVESFGQLLSTGGFRVGPWHVVVIGLVWEYRILHQEAKLSQG